MPLLQPDQAQMRVEVERLLERELDKSDVPKDKWIHMNMRSKVSSVLCFFSIYISLLNVDREVYRQLTLLSGAGSGRLPASNESQERF
jgi:hypothetical protein